MMKELLPVLPLTDLSIIHIFQENSKLWKKLTLHLLPKTILSSSVITNFTTVIKRFSMTQYFLCFLIPKNYNFQSCYLPLFPHFNLSNNKFYQCSNFPYNQIPKCSVFTNWRKLILVIVVFRNNVYWKNWNIFLNHG